MTIKRAAADRKSPPSLRSNCYSMSTKPSRTLALRSSKSGLARTSFSLFLNQMNLGTGGVCSNSFKRETCSLLLKMSGPHTGDYPKPCGGLAIRLQRFLANLLG